MIRTIFYPMERAPYVKEERIIIPEDFGFETIEQKQECIMFLHDVFLKNNPLKSILEISTKSLQQEGVNLSAFNLQFYVTSESRTFAVENIYQSSKVFELGGNYRDLLYVSPKEAKKDMRLINSGKVIKYIFESYEYPFDEIEYPAKPIDAFFDYIYMTALMRNRECSEKLFEYDAFGDIEFEPLIGSNCQARAAAKYVGKTRAGEIKKVDDIIKFCVEQKLN